MSNTYHRLPDSYDSLKRREAVKDAVYVWVLANHPDVVKDAMVLVDNDGHVSFALGEVYAAPGVQWREKF